MQYKKLEPEFKEKWIEALRSGRYKQGEERLCEKDDSGEYRFCCLGVGEIVAGNIVKNIVGYGMPSEITDDGADSKLPDEFLASGPDSISSVLAYMNDGSDIRKIKKHSFEEIADFIEQNL